MTVPHIQVMPGLGDAIYHRPFIRDLQRRATLETRWPELFADFEFSDAPPSENLLRARYNTKTLAFFSVPEAIGRAFPAPRRFVFDLPNFPVPAWKRPYAIIRAPTLRRDFYAPARNPDGVYLARAAELLKARGFDVVGIAKADGGNETFDGEPPPVDRAFYRGELNIPRLMGAVAHAAMIVAGPGWTVPAAIAAHVPHVVVYGGAAKWNALPKLIDPRMGTPAITAVEPDRFCRACKTVRHTGCDKTITDFDRKFGHAVDLALRMRRSGFHRH